MKFEVDIEVQTSLQAYMDFKSPLSQSRTSLEAYIDFKFHVSQSRTSIQAYVDLNSSHAVFMAGDGNYIWEDGEDAPQIPQTYRRKFGVPLKKAYDIMNEGVAVNMGGPAIGPLDFHIKA
jgi:hypothetical protein